MSEENQKKCDDFKNIIDKIEKIYGKGAIMSFNSKYIKKIPIISTGSLSLDLALGVGGLPKGRIIEIYGPESSGKTTLSLQCIRENQKHGGDTLFVDAEHAFSEIYAENLGIDLNKVLISQPDNGEEAFSIIETVLKEKNIDLIIVDSVAALVPKSEIEGDIGDCYVGSQARLMSKGLRKITGLISKTNCICVFINQIREKIGVMFGSPETTPGGNALKFFSSVRLDIRRISQIKDENGNIIGNRTRVKVVKNKVAPPFKIAEFDIIYGEGVSRISETIDLSINNGILKKNGSWLYYGNEKLGQGRDSVEELLEKDKVLSSKIEKSLIDYLEEKKNIKN